MACLFALLMVAFPRLAIVLLFFFTNYFSRAFHSTLLLLIVGFVFLPLTTLVYAWIVNIGQPIAGIYLIAIIVAVLADIGLLSGGEYHRRRV